MRQKADELLDEDENLYVIEYLPAEHVLTIELVANDNSRDGQQTAD